MSGGKNKENAARKKVGALQSRCIIRAALIAAILAAVGIFHAQTHSEAVLQGKKLSQENRRNRELLRENDELKIRRASLSAATRLESIAKEQLDLGQPTARQVISIRDESTASNGKGISAVSQTGASISALPASGTSGR